MAVDAVDAEKMQRKLLEQGIPAAIVGKNHRAGRNRNLCDTEQEMVRQGRMKNGRDGEKRQ